MGQLERRDLLVLWQVTNRSVSWQDSGDPEPPVQWHTLGDSL